MMKTELFITSDGSSTIYLSDLGEHYHSIHGAVQESMHVYIDAGLKQCTKNELTIFEVGFGTGLNCLLTFREAQNKNLKVHYFAVEKYPLSEDVWRQLNYEEISDQKESLLSMIHTAPWNCDCLIGKYGSFVKINSDLFDLQFDSLPSFDLIYFDAFSPEKQPEMWQQSIFNTLFLKLNNQGILITYCAKGEVRRKMKAAGFVVERIPGPPGKREMLRGRKI